MEMTMLSKIVTFPCRSRFKWSRLILNENDNTIILATRLANKSVRKIEKVIHFKESHFFFRAPLYKVCNLLEINIPEVYASNCILFQLKDIPQILHYQLKLEQEAFYFALLGFEEAVVLSAVDFEIYDDIPVI
jgi:hypothetical protein